MSGTFPRDFGLPASGASKLTATGSSQADAFQLGRSINVFTTVAAGTGAVLPSSYSPGAQVTVINRGANSLTVYPPVGDQIESYGVNVAMLIVAGGEANFACLDAPASGNPRTWWVRDSPSPTFGTVTANTGNFGNLSGSTTATGGTTARSMAARFGDMLNVKDFGAVGDGVTDDSAAVAAATTEATTQGKRILFFPETASNTYYLPTLADTVAANMLWVSDVFGVATSGINYVKNITQLGLPSAPQIPPGVLPAVHLKNTIAAAGAGAVSAMIIGDSLAGLSSGGLGPMGTAPHLLMRKFQRDNPGITFTWNTGQSKGGATFTDLLSNQSAQSWWPSSYSTGTWINGITTVTKPNLVILCFGCNDLAAFPLANFLTVVADLVAANIDVVFYTDSPKAISQGFSTSQTAQQNQGAMFLRSYAAAEGYGFIDGNRMGNVARDGYDVAETVIFNPAAYYNGSSAVMTALPYTWPLSTYDFGFNWYVFSTAGADPFAATGEIQIQLGAAMIDSGNVLRIGKDSGGNIYYKIDISNSVNFIPKTVTSFPSQCDGTGRAYFEVVVKGTQVLLNFQNDTQVIFEGNVPRFGGPFTPQITCTNGSVSFYGVLPLFSDLRPRFAATLTDTEMWGAVGYNPAPGYGGNNGVHPTNLQAELVTARVIDEMNLALPLPTSGTWTPQVKFNGASVGVTYTTQSGQWIALGNLIIATFEIYLSSKGSSTGSAQIYGLPFAVGPRTNGPGGFVTYAVNFSGITQPNLQLSSGSSGVVLTTSITNGSAAADTNFSNSTGLSGTVIYTRT